MNKKIDLYINGKYICSTVQYSTCKEFLEKLKGLGFIIVAGKGVVGLNHENDKITVRYSE